MAKNFIKKCDFHEIFSKVSREMLILIHIPGYKHYFVEYHC